MKSSPQLFGDPRRSSRSRRTRRPSAVRQPVQFVVRHPDFDVLAVGMDTLVTRARLIPGLLNVDTDLRVNKPELTV